MKFASDLGKAIRSLAFIKVSWDQQRKSDYIQSFVPFLCSLIISKKYKSIPSDPKKMMTITNDFKEEFGLIISYHALVTLIRRAKNMNLLENRNNVIYPTDKIYSYDIREKIKEFSRKYEKVLEYFASFSINNYKIEITKDKAEEILIGFLKQYDLQIIFLLYENTPLPEVEIQKKDIFLFSKYVNFLNEKEPVIFKFLVDIAVGYSLSNIMNYGDEMDNVSKSSLKGTNLYFDTGFIFQLIGAEGETFQSIYSSMVKDLSREGANLFVFNHTYDEVITILENCLMLIESPHYDPTKANEILKYFKELGYNESDVELFINKVDYILRNHNIKICENPDSNMNIQYQIDEIDLQNLIIETYGFDIKEALEKEETILKDVKSISYIYKLRAGRKPTNLFQAHHVFITCNASLAYACKIFEQKVHGKGFFIPAMVTDIFLGTILWLNQREKFIKDSEERLLARVSAALSPNDELLRRFADEVNKLKIQGEITEDDYILLRDSHVAKTLLTDETLGDPNNFTPKTAIDILNEIDIKYKKDLLKERELFENDKRKIQEEASKRINDLIKEKEDIKSNKKISDEEANKKIIQEKEQHNLTKQRLEKEQNQRRLIEEKIDKRADKIANSFAILFIIIFLIIAIISYVNLEGPIRYLIVGLSVIPILLSLIGISAKEIKQKIKKIIIEKIIK
jgi:hypothetical protein